MTERQTYRQLLSDRLKLPLLSFRACRVIELYNLHDSERLRKWLMSNAPKLAVNCGPQTIAELRQACGMRVQAAKELTQAGKLAAAHRRIVELEAEVNVLKWTVEKMEAHIQELRAHAV